MHNCSHDSPHNGIQWLLESQADLFVFILVVTNSMTLVQSSNPRVIESHFSKVSWSGYVRAKAALKFSIFLSR